ncbi:accessory factor UbiK family protein [Castellaniella sp.]|uniref:accessory factor UbiK family protein n=1 Tax=Castellaniella sp. TaxID=1955812 RepID=UPI003C790EBF
MIAPNQWLDDFQKNVSDMLAKTPAADIERNMKALMAQTFARMDLITREEFDIQAALLARALDRVQVLESRVQALEQAQTDAGLDKTQ